MRKAAAILVLTVLGLSACSSGSSKTLSKQEFITQADAICKKYTDQGDTASKQLEDKYKDSKDFAALGKDALTQLMPIERAEIADLKTLKPSSADKAQVQKLLDEVTTATDQLEQKLKTDPAGAFTSSDFNPYAQADTDAKAFGLTECGSTSS